MVNKTPVQRHKPERTRPTFDAPTQAIDEFLECLLEPVQEYHPSQEVLEQRRIALEQAAAVKEEVQVEEVVEMQAASESAPLQPVIPSYAEHPFQCLLFRASGSDFAIPLVMLHSIVKPSKAAAALPGQPVWHRGILLHRDQRVGLVDLGQLLSGTAETESTPFVIILGEGRFGLLSAEIFRPITLEADQVKWRKRRNERPWMMGTLREQLCPLIDAEALLRMLH